MILIIYFSTFQEIAFQPYWLLFLACHVWDQGWPTLITTIRDNCLRPAFPHLFTAASVQSFLDYICLNNKQINSSIHWRDVRSKGKVRFSPLLFIPHWGWPILKLMLGDGTDDSVLSCPPGPLWPLLSDWKEKANLWKQNRSIAHYFKILNWFLTLKLRRCLMQIGFSGFF